MQQQSSIIAAALVIGFIIFTVIRGQLACWLEVLGIGTGGQCGTLTGITGAAFALNATGGGLSITPPGINIGGVQINPPTINV